MRWRYPRLLARTGGGAPQPVTAAPRFRPIHVGTRARAVADDELEGQLRDAERAVDDLRGKLQGAVAWRGALDAEEAL